jgi:thiol:disulfide interchange protein
VPLVLVFPADLNKPPIVLPEILTKGIVLEALAKAKG